MSYTGFKEGDDGMLNYKKLTLETWDDFFTLFQKHKGVRGGCWCAFYLGLSKDFDYHEKDRHREIHKEHLQEFGSTGIVVYDDTLPVGYCQVASYHVIERFDYSKAYQEINELTDGKQNWRISCIFVDKDHRKIGLASKVFLFAIDHIRSSGGGWLEVFPFEYEETETNQFTFNGSVPFYLKHGFERVAKLGAREVLMRKYIESGM